MTRSRWRWAVPVPPGGGRKRAEDTDPGLVEALDKLLEPETRGDPMTLDVQVAADVGSAAV